VQQLQFPEHRRKAEHLGFSARSWPDQLDDVETTALAQKRCKAPQQRNFIYRHQAMQGEIADDRIECLVREWKLRVRGHFNKVDIVEVSAPRRARVPSTFVRLDCNKADIWVAPCEGQCRRKALRPDDQHLLAKIGIKQGV